MLTEFILNNELIKAEVEPGLPLLDFIREKQQLKGTKTGCREGDCGACTILEGELAASGIFYRTINSCLEPMVNVAGKHIVTIEGLNTGSLNPAQRFMVEHNGTQCGFCTPGFIVSMMSYLLNAQRTPIDSVSGNICRCTGYKSIEKALESLKEFKNGLQPGNRIGQLVEKKILPGYFNGISARLKNIDSRAERNKEGIFIGGGTDLMVQKPDEVFEKNIIGLKQNLDAEITKSGDQIHIGAAMRIQDFFEDPLIGKYFPQVANTKTLFASEQIRNMGTIAGNIVNASPIGDLIIILLALDASLDLLDQKKNRRRIKLKDFYLSYKNTALKKEELVDRIILSIPDENFKFSFTKVSKRTYLDIATVNSAIGLTVIDEKIKKINFAIGGVSAIPYHSSQTADYLTGKFLVPDVLNDSLNLVQAEISPISDVRGSEQYKRLLARQHFLGHFIYMYPEIFKPGVIKDMMIKNPVGHEEH